MVKNGVFTKMVKNGVFTKMVKNKTFPKNGNFGQQKLNMAKNPKNRILVSLLNYLKLVNKVMISQLIRILIRSNLEHVEIISWLLALSLFP